MFLTSVAGEEQAYCGSQDKRLLSSGFVICVFWIFLVIQYRWFRLSHLTHLSALLLSSHHFMSPFFSSQPIVDLSPIRRSASSLPQQQWQEVGLKEYDLERPNLAQSSTGPRQDRAHHHHHHHRCHRRRDKDKKQKSLDRAASMQPSSTVGEKNQMSQWADRDSSKLSFQILEGIWHKTREQS